MAKLKKFVYKKNGEVIDEMEARNISDARRKFREKWKPINRNIDCDAEEVDDGSSASAESKAYQKVMVWNQHCDGIRKQMEDDDFDGDFFSLANRAFGGEEISKIEIHPDEALRPSEEEVEMAREWANFLGVGKGFYVDPME